MRPLLTLLQFELLDSFFIWSDSGTLDADAVFLDRLRSINCYLVIGLVTILQALVSQVSLLVPLDQKQRICVPDHSTSARYQDICNVICLSNQSYTETRINQD